MQAAQRQPATVSAPSTSVLVALGIVLLLGRTASAQTDAKPEVAKAAEMKPDAKPDAKPDDTKPPGPPPPEWKAQAKGGVLLTGGNSQTSNGSLSASVSRKYEGNKLALEGAVAYGTSNVFKANTDPAMPLVITSLGRTTVETTNSWLGRGRYDRFFTTNNSAFVTAQAAGDKIAGKAFFGGGQLGYSRQVLKNDIHLVVAELGYDFSYESYVHQQGKALDSVSVHSARVFVGESLKLSSETGITANLEALFNLNREGTALNVNTGGPGVDAFKDTRLVGKLAVTTTLRKRLGLSLGFTVKYDQNPAPRPIPPGSPAGASYDPTKLFFADKVDTLTEATLVYTFL